MISRILSGDQLSYVEITNYHAGPTTPPVPGVMYLKVYCKTQFLWYKF